MIIKNYELKNFGSVLKQSGEKLNFQNQKQFAVGIMTGSVSAFRSHSFLQWLDRLFHFKTTKLNVLLHRDNFLCYNFSVLYSTDSTLGNN